jgi:rubredoxin
METRNQEPIRAMNDDAEVLFALQMACEHDINHQAQALRTWLPRITKWYESRHPSPVAQGKARPIDMVLYCPSCGMQHIDEPQPHKDWTNPPHRSHECQHCGAVWRPADVPTNGVRRIATKGKRDTAALDSRYASPAHPAPPKPTAPNGGGL